MSLPVTEVAEERPVPALCVVDVEKDAEVDAKDELALGGCGSGVRVDTIVCQGFSASGLRLRLRSPSPSIGVD